MFFKRLALLAFSAIFSFSLAGCSLYEGPPPPRKKDFTQGDLACLKGFNAQLTSYFDGKATPDDVNRIAACSVTALKTFGEMVRGENRDRFTAQEIRDFIQYYFLDDVTISDGLLREFMRVKQALVGGKETDFTPEDLLEAESLINVFRDIFLRLQPAMPMSMERTRTSDVAYVEMETAAIQDAGDIFGKRITEKDSTYSFDEMGRLFDEIIRAFPGTASTLGGLRGNLKIAAVLKEMLISPNRPRGTVTAAEWRLIFQDGSRWLGNYMKYSNLNGNYPDWTRGEGRARLARVSGETIDLLNRVVARHCPTDSTLPDGSCTVVPGIPFKIIQEAIQDTDWNGSIGGIQFEKATIGALIEPLFRGLFAGTDTSVRGRGTDRVTTDHLERVRTVIQEWVDGSRYVEGLYAKLLSTRNFPENATVATADIVKTDVKKILGETGGVTPSAIHVAEGLRDNFQKTFALMDTDSAGAVFDGKNKTRGRVYRELARYTWLRPLLKLGVLGYMTGPNVPGREKNVDRDGLTVTEFGAMIHDYWQLLKDFRLVGIHNTAEGDAKNRFREASLFMPVSDGNSQISIDEGVQLVLFMLSANPMGNEVHHRMTQICPIGTDRDDYGEPTVEPNCYRAKLYDFRSTNPDTAEFWKPFPVIIHFYEALSDADQANFREYIERAARKSGVKPGDYFTSDASDSLPMMYHYIESLFLRFDTNNDGFLDKNEASVAFPVFRNTLAEISGMSPNDGKLLSAFYYLLAKGNPPVEEGMGWWSRLLHSAGFLWWHITRPDFKSDRLKVLEVFATLSNQPAKPALGF